jgi:hypothetical protein
MLGKVTERDISEVKPLGPIVAKTPSGFPLPMNRMSKPLAAPKKSLAATKELAAWAKKPEEFAPNSSVPTMQSVEPVEEEEIDDFRRGNTERVKMMNAQEVDEAMEEISSMLSSKTMAILKEKALAKQQERVAKQQEQRSGGSGGSGSGGEKAVSFATNNGTNNTEKEDAVGATGPPTYDITQMPPHIASTLSELDSLKRKAPEYVRQRLAWTAATPSSSLSEEVSEEGGASSGGASMDMRQALARTYSVLLFFLLFLFMMVSLSLLSIYYCLPAFSDTT